MSNTHRILTLSIAALLWIPLAATAAQPLLPAGNDDQVPQRLAAAPVPAGDFERAPVSFSWLLDPAAELSKPAPHAAESREFWMTVDGATLERGVDLGLSAPGALIRVSPARGAAPIAPGRLQMQQAGGRAVALEAMASAEQLRATGMAVNPGTMVVRTDRTAAAGRYRLQAAGASGRYVVHVFEPDSDVVLHAQPRRHHALGRGRMAVDVEMRRGARGVPARAEALLVAPDGESFPVRLRLDKQGRGTADLRLPDHVPGQPGLWELQVFANDGETARDARTAFAVAVPTARLDGGYDADPRRLQVELPLDVAADGRYEVRGVLYATGPDGVRRPVSQSHSAAWLAAGDGALTLKFDPAHLPAGYQAPFEVRQLELHDQTRMAPLEVREHGLRF
ncbi:DUF4785 domain-containing protein [Marilutibacter chinensis]|uniref:DUF4785 family protein n=1 Tax=Marilutibacter chinensis TaxID=2912247 RepID=A0ABS9HPV2_9GAMM|nr:DUF4785 domain-containing protein [Lysobacter chinensis]MCF7220264.1 DUF4785 family protein [Lysobacter chinensis]